MWSEKGVSIPIRGMSFALTGLPIFILIISSILGPGAAASSGLAIQGNPGLVSFNQGLTNQTTKDCSGYSTTAAGTCYPSGLPLNAVITCSSPSNGWCGILPNCSGALNTPAPLQCNNSCYQFIFPVNCAASLPYYWAVLAQGATLVTSNGQIQNTKHQVGFLFGTLTAADLVIVIIGVVVSIAAVVGLNVFGSGESSEAIHILLMGGVFLGIWILLTGLDGFATSSNASWFVQMNGAFSGLGTFAYFMISLLYLLGFIKTVSRGE